MSSVWGSRSVHGWIWTFNGDGKFKVKPANRKDLKKGRRCMKETTALNGFSAAGIEAP